MPQEYVLYGPSISLFTRKLEAALRFYGAPFRRELPTPEIGSRAGTHQVPVLVTPENWAIADTTPILEMLDGRFPARRLFPEGEAGVLAHVVEEVLDEWVARVMVHFRWHYEENTVHAVSEILGRDVGLEEAREFPVAKWGPRACRASGTESEHQQRAAESEYLGLLGVLEEQLGSTPFALGDRPTAADTILLGGLRAHTNNDPIPDLSAFPRVLRWDAGGADTWDGGGTISAPPDLTPFAQHMLERARDQYRPFMEANRRALAAGDKTFVIQAYGEEVSFLARAYPEQSRQMVVARIQNQLDAGERATVLEWLSSYGLDQCFGRES